MLSAFTARPIIELKQRDKSKIETIVAYGTEQPRPGCASIDQSRYVARFTDTRHVQVTASS